MLDCDCAVAVKKRDYDDGGVSFSGNFADFNYQFREADDIFREFFGGKDPFEAFFGGKDPFEAFFANSGNRSFISLPCLRSRRWDG